MYSTLSLANEGETHYTNESSLPHHETEAMDPDHLKTPVAAHFHVEKTTPIAYISICIKVETVRHFL